MSPSELEQRHVTIAVNPLTGEVATKDSATDILAGFIDDLDDLKRRLETERFKVSEELIARMDSEAKWTASVGPYKVSAPSPDPGVEYDGEKLYERLWALYEDALVHADAVSAALEVETVMKPKKRGINALLKLGGKVAEAIRECERPAEPKPRRVRVTRA